MKLLVVDDDELMQLTLKAIFKDAEVHTADSVEGAEKLLEQHVFNAAFLDIQLKNQGSGLELLRRIRERDRYLPTVMISGIEDQPTIMKCLELGAVDYVVKGTVMPEAYRFALYKSSMWRKLLADSFSTRYPGGTALGPQAVELIKGSDPSVQELKNQIQRVGKLPGPFLISGETGTGKELVARALWGMMGDKNRPFIAVNCASLPESLVESELFGYEKGAFTGALQAKTGLFEAANGGDLFLDEIGELDVDLQAKLLRVLQEKTVRRLGSDRERPVNVRVIAATHVDLPSAIEEKAFREDLFYRLNVHLLQVSALRERPDDIIELLKMFLAQVGFRNVTLESEARQLLESFRWPGNVRQLRSFAEHLRGHLDHVQNAITKAMVERWMAQNRTRSAAQASSQTGFGINAALEVQKALNENRVIPVVEMLDTLQRQYVTASMEATQKNRSRAARLLGVSRQRLCNWLSQWGLD